MRLVEELTAQRAEERVGETVEVLVESLGKKQVAEGRAEHQGPEVDGVTTLIRRAARHRGRRPADRDRSRAPTGSTSSPKWLDSGNGRAHGDRQAEQLEHPERADHAAHR